MGDDSNQFHREVVRPKVSELLDIKEDDFILDIACGNGKWYFCICYTTSLFCYID